LDFFSNLYLSYQLFKIYFEFKWNHELFINSLLMLL